MKLSLIATTVIAALFACLGWQDLQRLHRARNDYARVLAQAREQGMEPTADGNGLLLSSKTTVIRDDSQPTRELKAKRVARKITTFGKNTDVLWSTEDADDQDAVLEYEEGMVEAQGMDLPGLKLLVNEIVANAGLNDITKGTLVFHLGGYLSQEDPAHALDTVVYAMDRLKMDDIFNYNYAKLIGMTLRLLAAKDPQQALGWLKENAKEHPNAVSDEARSDTLRGLAVSDVNLAFSNLRDLGMTRNPQTFEDMGHEAQTVEGGYSALAALREYAAHAGSDEERQIAIKNTFIGLEYSLTKDGYEESSKRLELAALSPDETAALASAINPAVTEGETGRWIDWMSGKIPADQLAANVTRIMQYWTEYNYPAAGTWLSAAPDGPVKDAAVKSYASTVAATDPATASQWALTLPAGDDRAALMKDIYTEWKKQDEAAATKFAKDNGIGE
jgi:hypothetical protein